MIKMFDVALLVSQRPDRGGLEIVSKTVIVFAHDKDAARELTKNKFSSQGRVQIESLREFIPLENPGVVEVGLSMLMDFLPPV